MTLYDWLGKKIKVELCVFCMMLKRSLHTLGLFFRLYILDLPKKKKE